MIEEIGSDTETATLIGLAQGGAHYTLLMGRAGKTENGFCLPWEYGVNG